MFRLLLQTSSEVTLSPSFCHMPNKPKQGIVKIYVRHMRTPIQIPLMSKAATSVAT
jgi:hypothetical protein